MKPAQLARARRTAAGYLSAEMTFRRTTGTATFDPTTGRQTPGASTVVWSGSGAISDRRDPRAVMWGAQQLAEGQVLIRAALDAQTIKVGDEVTVDVPGDWPGATRLWVHDIPGRQDAVLARIICTTTKPGDDGRS